MITLSSRNLGQFAIRCVIYSALMQGANMVAPRLMIRSEKRRNRSKTHQ